MPGTIPAARQHLIDAIARHTRQAQGDRPATLPLGEFVQAYYRGVGEDDLRLREPADFAASAATHLEFGRVRRRRRAAGARLQSGSAGGDGWVSPCTIVEVVTDDMPFLVDSLAMVLDDAGLPIQVMVHPVLQRGARRARPAAATRGPPGKAVGRGIVAARRRAAHRRRGAHRGAAAPHPRHARGRPTRRRRTGRRCATARAELAREITAGVPGVRKQEEVEASEFLEWLADNHFTFLGYREYRLERGRSVDRLVPVPRSGLGLLRPGDGRPQPTATELHGELRRKAREVALLIVTKANSVSTVHRSTYLDYVGVKTFDQRGNVVGERRFIGLFTSSTYSTSPREIPLLRHKVQRVVDTFGISADEPRRQGDHARARDVPARRAVPGERAGTRAHGARHRQPLRTTPRARVPAPRPVPPLLLVPALRAARPLQHAGPRAHRAHPDRGIRTASTSSRRCRCRNPRSRACTCSCARTPRATSRPTSSGSRRASPRRCAPGPTSCARNSRSQLPADRSRCAGRPVRSTLSRSRTRKTSRPHDAIRDLQELAALRDVPGALGMELRPGDAAPRRAAPAALPPRRSGRDVGHAAAARELRPAHPQRASVPRRRGRRCATLDPGPRGQARRRPHARSGAGRQALRGGVLRRAERARRKRRLQPARARRRPRLAPGARAARGLPLPAADRHPVQPEVHGGGARAQSVDRRAPRLDLRVAVRPGPQAGDAHLAGRRVRRGNRRSARPGHEPGRRPHPARLPRGDHGDAANEPLPARRRRASRSRTFRSSSTRRSCPTCRSRGRCSRSGCIRRASRACTCAWARSRAADCAGRTAARISAPRSSDS